MKPAPTLDVDDLRRAFDAASGDDAGMTATEMVVALGWALSRSSAQRLRDRIRPLLASGVMTVGRAHRMQISGVSKPVPVYRLTGGASGGRSNGLRRGLRSTNAVAVPDLGLGRRAVGLKR